jgi:hypothetical protein
VVCVTLLSCRALDLHYFSESTPAPEKSEGSASKRQRLDDGSAKDAPTRDAIQTEENEVWRYLCIIDIFSSFSPFKLVQELSAIEKILSRESTLHNRTTIMHSNGKVCLPLAILSMLA